MGCRAVGLSTVARRCARPAMRPIDRSLRRKRPTLALWTGVLMCNKASRKHAFVLRRTVPVYCARAARSCGAPARAPRHPFPRLPATAASQPPHPKRPRATASAALAPTKTRAAQQHRDNCSPSRPPSLSPAAAAAGRRPPAARLHHCGGAITPSIDRQRHRAAAPTRPRRAAAGPRRAWWRLFRSTRWI